MAKVLRDGEDGEAVFRRALDSLPVMRRWAPVLEQVAREAKLLDAAAARRESRHRQSRKPHPPRPWVERAWCNACNRTRVVGHEDHWRKE